MFFRTILRAIFGHRAGRRSARKLIRGLEEQGKATCHYLGVGLMDTYGVWPERLTEEQTKRVESHLSGCDWCRKQVQGLIERRDFFRRQKEPCD